MIDDQQPRPVSEGPKYEFDNLLFALNNSRNFYDRQSGAAPFRPHAHCLEDCSIRVRGGDDLLAGIQPAPWGVPLAQADEPATPTLH